MHSSFLSESDSMCPWLILGAGRWICLLTRFNNIAVRTICRPKECYARWHWSRLSLSWVIHENIIVLRKACDPHTIAWYFQSLVCTAVGNNMMVNDISAWPHFTLILFTVLSRPGRKLQQCKPILLKHNKFVLLRIASISGQRF